MKFLSSLLISLMVLVQFNSPVLSQSNNRKLQPAPLKPAEFLVLQKYKFKNQSPSTSSNFDEADALFGKRTTDKEARKPYPSTQARQRARGR